ncbi:uncharacterized protein Tco025E_07057 [Trypanosoma conorhini]|uniref:Uncharacterized protein n=1 Tax=Trypanosoma conorhini TaxID=83891 RepID=A0A422NU72_9TRYP|nr:uncharacterized protein Tco025E_07057 [Trypanosoma conorhini]RNF08999.1 hypothetical protein Tco025E_07057 [Trypanosoma conorhini]
MELEQLRRGIEEQERRVAALRQEKQRRDALLGEVRALIGGVMPPVFDELSCDVQELFRTLKHGPPVAESSTTTTAPAGSSPRDVDPGGVPLFSSEMEERIMQAEEPPLQKQVPHKGRRSRRRRNGEGGRGEKSNRAGKERHAAARHMEPCPLTLNEAEISAREALMAALDSLQLEPCGSSTRGRGVPPWLSEAETQHPQNSTDKGEEEVVEAYYSDDFEELTDVER